MTIRRISSQVIVVSSVIICSVFALTLFGFYAYLQWKEEGMRIRYKAAICDIDTHLFEKYVLINLRAKIAKNGIYKDKPVVEGTIKNISNKQIYSLELKITFYDSQRRVIYQDSFYPISSSFETSLTDIGDNTKNLILEGDSSSFTHQLVNCPPKVIYYLKAKMDLAKLERPAPLELAYKIERLDIR